jgi:integrase
VLTDEEEMQFFKAVSTNPLLRDVVKLALRTGMRKAEVLNLKREDVVIVDLGGFVVLKDTKNGESRKVMLTKELTEIIKRVINEVPDSDYVFSGRNGKPRADIKDSFNKLCRSIGIND